MIASLLGEGKDRLLGEAEGKNRLLGGAGGKRY
jgi:hypothetical protein